MMNVHVYPVAEEHRHHLDGLDCPCKPEYECPCSQCELGAQSCWKCNGEGITTCTKEEALGLDNVVVIHKVHVTIFEGDDGIEVVYDAQ